MTGEEARNDNKRANESLPSLIEIALCVNDLYQF